METDYQVSQVRSLDRVEATIQEQNPKAHYFKTLRS